jgi:hypothetical protein
VKPTGDVGFSQKEQPAGPGAAQKWESPSLPRRRQDSKGFFWQRGQAGCPGYLTVSTGQGASMIT